MFLDASALVAIFNEEEGSNELELLVAGSTSQIHVSPMVKFETSLAIARAAWERSGGVKKDRATLILEARNAVEKYLSEIDALEMPITPAIGAGAVDAVATYGKVVGHKAALNLGDCFAYACAKASGASLLYKGNDFSETDLA
jgi:ribonuclease VapC